MSEKSQKREEIGRAIDESDCEAVEGATGQPGGVSTYTTEHWSQYSSEGAMNYVLSALDFITCSKCQTTYVKGDEHDCSP